MVNIRHIVELIRILLRLTWHVAINCYPQTNQPTNNKIHYIRIVGFNITTHKNYASM